MIQVQTMREERKFHPDERSSTILTKMKETSEAYLGTKVNDAPGNQGYKVHTVADRQRADRGDSRLRTGRHMF